MANKKSEPRFEDVSSFSSKSQYNKATKAKRRPHRGLKVVLSIFCVLLILAGAGVIYVSTYLFGGLSTNPISKDKETLGIASGVTADHRITNIALFGLDTRGNDFTGRSDAIMVISIDQIHNKIKLTSILRDSLVYMGEGYPGTEDNYDKINHAYAYGGAEMAIRALNTNFNLNIEDYVSVNFGRLAEIIDSFGGVDISVTDAELGEINKNMVEIVDRDIGATDSDYLTTGAGVVHLNGAQAVAYSRIRYLDSDNKRAERQQIVLSALLEKVTTIPALEYPGIVNKLCSLSETSMNPAAILGFAPFALSSFTIERMTVPGEDAEHGETSYGGWVWTYDTAAAALEIEEFIYEKAPVGTGETTE